MGQGVKGGLGAAYSECFTMARLLVPMNWQKLDQCVFAIFGLFVY